MSITCDVFLTRLDTLNLTAPIHSHQRATDVMLNFSKSVRINLDGLRMRKCSANLDFMHELFLQENILGSIQIKHLWHNYQVINFGKKTLGY